MKNNTNRFICDIIKGCVFFLFVALILVSCDSKPSPKTQSDFTPTPVISVIPDKTVQSTVPPSVTDTSGEQPPKTENSDPTVIPDPGVTITPDDPPKSSNIFDGYMEYGGLNDRGEEFDNDQMLRTGYVEVEPNFVYTLSTVQVGEPFVTGTVMEYDENKNYIRRTLMGGRVCPFTFVTSEDTKYIRWYTNESIYSTIEAANWIEYWLEEGCESTPWNNLMSNYYHDIPKSTGVENVLKRLSYFCDTQLVTSGSGMVIGYTDPLKLGQANPYTSFVMGEGKRIIGIPYSSLRKTDAYVGFEVSLETYMTAINNPAGIMYTENYQDPGSQGYSPFIYYVWNPYGAVCSTMIGYSLDLDIRYSTYEWSDIYGMKKVDINKDGLMLGDVLCNVTSSNQSGGHIAMVTDIIRDAEGKIMFVRITEAGIPTMLQSYVFYDYFKYAYLAEYSVYRYDYIDSVSDAVCGYIDGTKDYNNALALDRGDVSVYQFGNRVEINVMSLDIESLNIEIFDDVIGGYSFIANADMETWQKKRIQGKEYTVYSFIPRICGKYRISGVMKDGTHSEPVHFICADSGDISVSNKDGQTAGVFSVDEKFTVEFFGYEGCTPLYVCIETDKYVTRSQRMLTEEEIALGKADISYYTTGKCYVKIYYQNEFGRICSGRVSVEFK